MKILMGIDFSTKALHCTYGTLDQEKPWIIRIPVEGVAAEEWIGNVYDRLSVLLESIENLGDLDLGFMVIELPFFGRNAGTTIKLAQVQSAAIAACHTHQWVTCEMDPSKIRKKVLGVGGSSVKGEIKQKAMDWVEAKYHLGLDSDEADSVVIWEYAKMILEESA